MILFTDSMVIAKGSGNQHKNVKELIVNYDKELSELGRVTFKTHTFKTNGGLQERTYYELNEMQAGFLLTLMRNSKPVVAFKLALVKEFYRMRQYIMERQTTDWLQTILKQGIKCYII